MLPTEKSRREGENAKGELEGRGARQNYLPLSGGTGESTWILTKEGEEERGGGGRKPKRKGALDEALPVKSSLM